MVVLTILFNLKILIHCCFASLNRQLIWTNGSLWIQHMGKLQNLAMSGCGINPLIDYIPSIVLFLWEGIGIAMTGIFIHQKMWGKQEMKFTCNAMSLYCGCKQITVVRNNWISTYSCLLWGISPHFKYICLNIHTHTKSAECWTKVMPSLLTIKILILNFECKN